MANMDLAPAIKQKEPVSEHTAHKHIRMQRYSSPGYAQDIEQGYPIRIGNGPGKIPEPLMESLEYVHHERQQHAHAETEVTIDEERIRFPFLLGIRKVLANRRLANSEEVAADEEEIARLERKQLMLRHVGRALVNGWGYNNKTVDIETPVEGPLRPGEARKTLTTTQANPNRPITKDEIHDTTEMSELIKERFELENTLRACMDVTNRMHLNMPPAPNGRSREVAQRALMTGDYGALKDILVNLPPETPPEVREAAIARLFPSNAAVEQHLLCYVNEAQRKEITKARRNYSRAAEKLHEVDEEFNEVVLGPTHQLEKLTGNSQDEILSKISSLEEAQAEKQARSEERRQKLLERTRPYVELDAAMKVSLERGRRNLIDGVQAIGIDTMTRMGLVRDRALLEGASLNLAVKAAVEQFRLRQQEKQHEEANKSDEEDEE